MTRLQFVLLFLTTSCLSTTFAQSRWVNPAPEGLTQYEWRGLRQGWDLRARTVEVITDDQASVYGFFLGAYEEGIAVLKDQPHPFVTAEKMEVVLVPQDQVRKVTLRTLHNRTYRPLAAGLAISALGSPFV
ncbi:MAG TPA: hypothetical protein DCE41_19595, partial [Cytophagales bacterium]|nr:hypothetical protein [Cytophagales bacterium]